MHTDQPDDNRDRRPTMERHIQTFLISVSVLLVAWMGSKLMQVSESQIAMKATVEVTAVQMKTLNAELADLRNQMREFYLRSEAERNNADIYNWLRRHDDRLIKLERGKPQ